MPHGLRDFSAHTEQVAGWWRRYPQANIGLLPPAGYFGLDVDDPATWQARGPALPRVGPVQLTGSGGGRRQHLYHLDGHAPGEVAFNKPLAGYGVETKGDGDGYLVVAPSVTSEPYRWVRTGPVPVVPDALWAILPRTTERASGPTIAIEDCCVVPARIGRDPGGYDWLLKRAGHLRAAHRLTGPAARAVLLTALPAMDPPYPPGDGEAEIDRILAYDAAHPERVQAGRRGHATATPEPGPGIDAADLLALDLPPLRMVVPDLLPEGTTILAAPPKVGKSCLVYQIAVEVALGGSLFGRRVEPGSALYLALEDGHRRGQERLRAALGGRTMPRGRLEVRWGARRIGAGLEEDIAAWLDGHPDAALVAIDTLGRVRPGSDGRRNAYEVDVEDLGRLQGLFRDRPVALLIVHHTNKDSRDDFLALVSGTYGLTGSVDTIIVIRRKRLEAFGAIAVTGREVAESELAARFDGMTWQEAPDSLAEASFERAEVYRVIEEAGPIFPKAIADQLGLSRTSVQNMTSSLVADGAIARTGRGYVTVGVVFESHPSHRESSESPEWPESSVPGDAAARESSESPRTAKGSKGTPLPPSVPTTLPGDSSDSYRESHQSHRGDAREEGAADVPAPAGGCCPDCGLGPFISADYYERHWRETHDYPASAWDAEVPA